MNEPNVSRMIVEAITTARDLACTGRQSQALDHCTRMLQTPVHDR